VSKHQRSSTVALRELQAYRRAQRLPAFELSLVRWPERALAAGVAAKLERRPTYRDSRPGDSLAARILDRICQGLANAGVVSW
jgi:hypothetical protein